MEQPSRGNRISRRSWLLAGLATPLFSVRAAEPLEVKYDGDNLHLSAPTLHFLIGKPLERLKDGAPVAYVAQVTLFGDDHVTPIKRGQGRFVVSFALWEEKFFVTQLGTQAVPSRSVEGLTAAAAEVWCLDSLAVSTVGLEPNAYYWLRFELRTADQKELANLTEQPVVSFRRIVEFFSQRPKAGEPRWEPLERRLRLSDLPRMAGRGRNG
ncbi:MAG TPA: hypothetical protein VNY05_23095 [Candidatus Acidoferrales bacterium]|jgi:hypothetical protein|nr:hypothetical protein [Candidatus Acidoferrales bacterium]